MDRKKSKWRRWRNIRLLILAISICFYSNLNSLESLPIVKMEYSPSNPKIQELFKLKFIIETNSNYLLKSASSSPVILLNDKAKFLKFEQSRTYYDGKNTILEAQYKIIKSGLLKLDNIFLIIGKHKILQPIIELTIESLELSRETQFRIRLFDKDNNYIEHTSSQSVSLGEKYLLVIEGNFKKRATEKIEVEYLPENNSLIEQNDKNIDWLNLNNGWCTVSSFLWYPINTGTIKLPKIIITITTQKEKYAFTLKKEFVRVAKLEANESMLKNIEKETIKKKLASHINKPIKTEQNLSKKSEIACNIRVLRDKESKEFFYWKIKAKREKLERTLGIEHPLSVFNYKWYFLSLIFSAVLILILLFLLIIKKIRLDFLILLLLFSGIAPALYAVLSADSRKEYTLQDAKSDNHIYLNPEEYSIAVDSIEIGETVKIIYTIKDYKYVEKYNHVKGWIK